MPNWYGVSFGDGKGILKLDSGDVAQHCKLYEKQMLKITHFEIVKMANFILCEFFLN